MEVLPILVWSPTSLGVAPPPAMPDEVRRDRFGAVGGEDSLLSHAKLIVGAFPPSFATPTSGRWTLCPLRRLWLFCFREPLLYVPTPPPILFFFVSVLLINSLLSFGR